MFIHRSNIPSIHPILPPILHKFARFELPLACHATHQDGPEARKTDRLQLLYIAIWQTNYYSTIIYGSLIGIAGAGLAQRGANFFASLKVPFRKEMQIPS